MKRVMVVFVVLVAVLGFTQKGASLDYPNKVDGKAETEFLHEFGNDKVGGFSYGNAMGSFFAAGPSEVWGEANAIGTGLGESWSTPNNAFSKSSSSVYSNARAGCLQTEVEISGLAAQGNWAFIGNEQNFANGGNTTSGEYALKLTGNGPISIEGGALADGWTKASIGETDTGKWAKVQTAGKSSAYVTGTGSDPAVSGLGSIGAASYMQSGGITAFAGALGSANYSASGPRFAAGFLKITGHTNINLVPNGLNLSSHVSARSKAVSR